MSIVQKIFQSKTIAGANQAWMSNYWLRTGTEAATAIAIHKGNDRPDVTLGIFPFWGVTSIETASSQNILKYRAVGGQFLAHQHGGNISLRIDMILKGPTVPLQLGLLETLFSFGQARDKINSGILYQPFFKGDVSRALRGETTTAAQQAIQQANPTTGDNISKVGKDDYNWIRSEYHNTFAIASRDFVMTGMYVESFIYYRNVGTDPSLVYVSLLCRKFIPHPQITSVINEDVKRDTIIDAKMKNYFAFGDETIGIPLRHAQAVFQNQRYISTKNSKALKNHEMVDNMISVAHQLYNNVGTPYGYRNSPYDVLRDRNIRNSGKVLNAILFSAMSRYLRKSTENLNKKEVNTTEALTSAGQKLRGEIMVDGHKVVTFTDPDDVELLNSIEVGITRREIYSSAGLTIDVKGNSDYLTIIFITGNGIRRYNITGDIFAINKRGVYYIFLHGDNSMLYLLRYIGDVNG